MKGQCWCSHDVYLAAGKELKELMKKLSGGKDSGDEADKEAEEEEEEEEEEEDGDDKDMEIDEPPKSKPKEGGEDF